MIMAFPLCLHAYLSAQLSVFTTVMPYKRRHHLVAFPPFATGSILFSFGEDPFKTEAKTILTELSPLKVYFPLNLSFSF